MVPWEVVAANLPERVHHFAAEVQAGALPALDGPRINPGQVHSTADEANARVPIVAAPRLAPTEETRGWAVPHRSGVTGTDPERVRLDDP